MIQSESKFFYKSLTNFQLQVNESDKRLYRVLKIIKQREKTSLPIYFPNTRMIKTLKANPKKVKSLVWVEKRLFKGKYTNKPWKFIRDVNKVLDFVKNHHTKQSKTFVEVIKVSLYVTQRDQLKSRDPLILVTECVLMPNGYCNGRTRLLLWSLVYPGSAENHMLWKAEMHYHIVLLLSVGSSSLSSIWSS